MKTKAILFSILLAGASLSFAQQRVTSSLPSTGDILATAHTCGDAAYFGAQGRTTIGDFATGELRGSSKAIPFTRIQGAKGSAYLVDNFEKSTLYDNDEVVGTYYARFNAYSQELEVKKTNLEEEEYRALVRNENFKLVFADKEIQYASFIDNKGKKQEAYLISMTKGKKYDLLQRYKVRFIEGKDAENSMVNAVPDRFSNSTEFYLKDMNTNLVSYIPSKKSKLLQLFKESDKIQVASLIKKRSLNVKDGADLVKIFDFVNTISDGYVAKN